MAFERDIDQIEEIVLRRDLSFDIVDRNLLTDGLRKLRICGSRGELDHFLLSAMQVLALPKNGHTRIVPNAAIKVFPLRFVALGSRIYLTSSPSEYQLLQDMRLVAINSIPVADVLERLGPFLAGTTQRQRVIGPLLFTWPAALQMIGVAIPYAEVIYTLQDSKGSIEAATVAQDRLVPAQSLYPYREKGALQQGVESSPTFVSCKQLAPRVSYIAFRDFDDPSGYSLETELVSAIKVVVASPQHNLIVDMRGNPGGDFLRSLPFIRVISENWQGRRCAVLTDKFTFSAAIVFVALLKDTLKDALDIVGEEMGDDLRFFAEGGLSDLADTDAMVRYSNAYHDWKTGVPHLSTPDEIARHLVAVGDLSPDHGAEISSVEKRQGRDPQLEAALARLHFPKTGLKPPTSVGK